MQSVKHFASVVKVDSGFSFGFVFVASLTAFAPFLLLFSTPQNKGKVVVPKLDVEQNRQKDSRLRNWIKQ